LPQRARLFLLVAFVATLLAWLLMPTVDTGEVRPADVPAVEVASLPALQLEPLADDVPLETLGGDGKVHCLISADVAVEGQYRMTAWEDYENQIGLASVFVAVRNREVIFDAPFDEGVGLLVLPGHDQAALGWHAKGKGYTCRFLREPQRNVATLSGRVNIGLVGEGQTYLRGCGRGAATFVRSDGSFALTLPLGRCELMACRKWGMLEACGDGVIIDVAKGDAVDNVVLDAPEHAPAGIGIGLRAADQGIGVSFVRPGTPAEAAGLQPGDVIISVDGQATVDMDVQEFIRWGTGPEGTRVGLEVVDIDGQMHDVKITREHIR